MIAHVRLTGMVDVSMRTHPSRWVSLHAGFALVAVAVLLLPVVDTGPKVMALVIGYNIAVPVTARITGDRILMVTWATLAPMSVLMVLPDWFLSAVLGSLTFPNTGAPYIGTMPLFMAGMWTIALLPIMMLARQVEASRSVFAAFATAGSAGLVLFIAAEFLAPALPLWEPIGAAQIAGVAYYVLLPELGLCLASYELVRGAATRPLVATIGGIIAVPFMYLGMLVSAYQFLG